MMQLRMQEYLGAEIISHLVMHGTNVAEIVKHLITVLKKKDEDISTIFLEALKRVGLMIFFFFFVRACVCVGGGCVFKNGELDSLTTMLTFVCYLMFCAGLNCLSITF